ncbi:unnamed protein product, partial [Ectocarpus sp. 13 AM-2016]
CVGRLAAHREKKSGGFVPLFATIVDIISPPLRRLLLRQRLRLQRLPHVYASSCCMRSLYMVCSVCAVICTLPAATSEIIGFAIA